MFFKWFIPYPLWQSGNLAAVLFIPAAVAWFLYAQELPPVIYLGMGGLSFAAGRFYGYHHRVSALGCFSVVGAGWFFAFVAICRLHDVRLLYTAIACGVGAWASYRYQRQPRVLG
jgi:hypothetical protein